MKLLQNQVDSLQQKIIDLENQLTNTEYPLSTTLEAPDTMKTIQQPNYTLKAGKEDCRIANYRKVNTEVREVEHMNSDMLSEPSKVPRNDSFHSQKYNLSSIQKQPQNEQNFVTLSKISEQEKISIIQRGFQLQAIAKQYVALLREDKISLKKYYESTQQYSLFQRKGYFIKYETIRRTKLYTETKSRLQTFNH